MGIDVRDDQDGQGVAVRCSADRCAIGPKTAAECRLGCIENWFRIAAWHHQGRWPSRSRRGRGLKGDVTAASLGWVQTQRGDTATGAAMLDWIEVAATVDGMLPEQAQDHVQSPYMLQFWRAKWGQTATPLLWSHAMHVVLNDVCRPASA